MNYYKVEQLENKNQFVIYANNKIIFQSYKSIIAIYDTNKRVLTLGRLWDYSHTTSKHLYIYLNRFCCSVYGISEALKSSNTRRAIQKLIDKKIIKYNKELR